MSIEQLADAIINEIYTGLRGITVNEAISREQLIDEIISERISLIQELSAKNLLSRKDLMFSIDCIEIDTDKQTKCCNDNVRDLLCNTLHFEIPQIITFNSVSGIEFIGSVDKQQQYRVYTDISYRFNRYSRYGAKKPFVYIETTPNINNRYDCYLFNAPYTKYISIIGIFKDPRDLQYYSCCNSENYNNLSILSTEIFKRLVDRKIKIYRQFPQQILPNDQTSK